jgi:hypothetical protein
MWNEMEKCIEYKWLGRINFQGNKFNIYKDNKYRKFYLKIIEKEEVVNLVYPTLEEFESLNKMFGMNNIKKIMCFTDQKDLKLSDRKKVKFIPKIITKTGLVSLSVALMLCGCKSQSSNDNMTNLVDKLAEQETKKETKKEGRIVTSEESMTDEEILEHYGRQVDKIENGIYALKKAKIGDKTYKICKDVNEFKESVGIEGTTSYDDLLNAITNNENITGRYEEWLKEAITNLSQNKEFDGVDFSVLLYNIQRMKILEKTPEEIKTEAQNLVARAYFDQFTGEVAVNSENITKIVFLHEALGHATTEVIVEEGENIYFRTKAIISVLDRKENGVVNKIDNIMIGDGIEEGKADCLAEAALNYTEICSSGYSIEKETFREFKETLGLSWKDIINNGMTLKILAKMSEQGIKEPIQYIDNSDMLHYVEIFEEIDEEITFQNNIGGFLVEYAEAQLEKGRAVEEITTQISQMIQKSEYYDSYIGGTMTDFTNMQNYEKQIITSIENLKEQDKENEEELELE